MTEAEKSLLVKYRQQGKGCAEIARLLNVSANTVKSLSAKEPGGCRRGSGCSSGSGESQSTEGMLQTVWHHTYAGRAFAGETVLLRQMPPAVVA